MKTNVTVSDNIPANFSEEPTEAPEEPTEAPEEPTEAPEEPTEAPEEPTEAPEEPTEAPEEPTEAPEEPTEAPEEPTEAPEEPTEAPEKPTEAPEEPTEAPEKPTEAPEEPTEAPEEPTEAPEQPTEAPEKPTEAPEEPTEAPGEPTEAPGDSEVTEDLETSKSPITTEEPQDCDVACTGPWDEPEYHADPYDCNSFYQCSNGIPYHHLCPANLVFNTDLNVCDWPWSFECEPKCQAATEAPEKPTEAPEEPTEAPEEPTEAPEEPTEAPGDSEVTEDLETSESPITTEEPQDCDVACAGPWDEPEYHADPYDCNSFYQCSNGVPYHHQCPANLVFNTNLNVCDWPWSFECEPKCSK